ncbi:MAG: hypothetical protein H7X99_04460 [Saprospiraceae bacterium]|nr:hypothetical protein [Saprospiraceae bacterium]
MKHNLLILLFLPTLFISSYIKGQSDFIAAEIELAYHCDVMTNASESRHRVMAHEKFIEGFGKLLQKEGSYNYPFDSLKWISKKMPENKSFRIITWEVKSKVDEYKYYGFIQWSDGKLLPLSDHFKEAEDVIDEEFKADNWLGAVYYHLMEVKATNGSVYYLLFGVNRWSKFENIKLVDVLFFTKDNEPVFGKPVFRKSEKDEQDVFYNRLVFKYASDAQMTVNYNSGLEMIVFDNLIPKMSRIPGQGQTLVPDGSYVGFSLDKNYWNRVDKIATEVMETAPRPNPVLDQRKGKKIFGN